MMKQIACIYHVADPVMETIELPNIKERVYKCNVALKSITLNTSSCTGVAIVKDTMPG